jgi:hypothetical protein
MMQFRIMLFHVFHWARGLVKHLINYRIFVIILITAINGGYIHETNIKVSYGIRNIPISITDLYKHLFACIFEQLFYDPFRTHSNLSNTATVRIR